MVMVRGLTENTVLEIGFGLVALDIGGGMTVRSKVSKCHMNC
jgi:hypothetical protein